MEDRRSAPRQPRVALGSADGGAAAAAAPNVDKAAALGTHLHGLCKAWSAQRGGTGMAAAVWEPGMGAFRVAVTNSAARLLDSAGFIHDGRHYLHFEEAAFLSDRGALLLFADESGGRAGAAGKRLLALQEAFHTMACFGVPLERYITYSGLSRLGFIQQGAGAARAWWPRAPGWLLGGGAAVAEGAAPPHAVASDLGAALWRAFPRLRPLPRISSGAGAAAAAGDTVWRPAGEGCVAFDVFAPNAAFSRRRPGAPLCAVAMHTAPAAARGGGAGTGGASGGSAGAGCGGAEDGCGCGGFPPLASLLALWGATAQAPLRFAVLEASEPCFYELQSADLIDVIVPRQV
ncbi:MAG: hypothetical protein J3K34DRAFT_523581 [Monoraphidium minutum]|nr:MAG: hypothetical protein J3K34DRAFT_523581 [Monoraphidium minutum]